MTLLNYINQDTIKELNNYLALKNPPGLILQGIHGLGKRNAANYLAAKLLNTTPDLLKINPDFYELHDTKQVKVEDISELLVICNRHSVGKRKIIIIDDAHTITPATQNRLLKVLEDQAEKNIIIMICEKDLLLSTIKSRCYSISFHPYQEKGIQNLFKDYKIAEEYWDFLGFLIENAPYAFINNQELINEYIQQYDKVKEITMREDILSLFHFLKEKDSNEFFSAHSENPEWNIRIILFPFYKMIQDAQLQINSNFNFPYNLYSYEQAMSILQYGMEHLRLANRLYTKNDYFNLLRFIIQAK